MLEKLGLPAKPAARGASWVLDASHCQGCSSAFSVFNRKHHCRRCGGIFCGNCTSQRLVLRGQGDNPVRICEPCKKLEESARFEARPWHKNKIVKGGSKSASAGDTDALLKQLLGEGSPSSFVTDDLSVEKLLEQHGAPELSSSSGGTDGVSKKGKQGHSRGTSLDNNDVAANEPLSPEKLHELASEEKKKYTLLKRDGRSDEALKAFKRSKELERQAEALELSLRKSKRKASMQSDEQEKSGISSRDLVGLEGKSSALKGRRASSVNAADQNDDVLNALKELGWNDVELQEKPQKRVGKHGVDSDLEAILENAENASKPPTQKKVFKTSAAPETSGSPAQMQILGHKRRALALKKEGKMVEAKEELKKAKILERELEEAAFLGDEDEEDDELAVLMRSLEREATLGDKSNRGNPMDASIDLSKLTAFNEDEDDTVDVSDADLNDPAMVEALRSMGWTEEAHALQRATQADPALKHFHSVISKEQDLQKQILDYKRRALALRREGKGEEAQAAFKRSKVLEQELQELKNSSATGAHQANAVTRSAPAEKSIAAIPGLDAILYDGEVDADVTEDDMQDPELMSALMALGFAEEPPPVKQVMAAARPHSKDKAALQQEILAIKRSALALKREGKTAEAKEQLMRSRALEQTLQIQQQDLKFVNDIPGGGAHSEAPNISGKVVKEGKPSKPIAPDFLSVSEDEDETGAESEAEVEESDYMDPDIAAALQAVGWQDDTSPQKVEKNKEFKAMPVMVPTRPVTSVDSRNTQPQSSQKSRSELQKELLGLKRRALGLRREGKSGEADEVLRQARTLENQLDEIQVTEPSGKSKPPKEFSQQPPLQPSLFAHDDAKLQVTDEDLLDPQLLAALQNMGWKEEANRPFPDADSLESLVAAQSPKGLSYVKTEDRAANSSQPAGTSGDTLSWNGQARKDENILGPGVPSKQVTGADASQRTQGTWDEQDPFGGEYGEMGGTVDIAPPLFDHPFQKVGNLLKSVMPPSAASPVKGTAFDLLTGDIWAPAADAKTDAHPPAKNVCGSDEEEVDGVLDPGLMAALAGLGITDSKKEHANTSNQPANRMVSTGRGEDKATAASGPVESIERKVTPSKDSQQDGNRNRASPSHTGTGINQVASGGLSAASLQQEIMAHKRTALALKREGKRSEATDALRQAKLLEQQLYRLQLGGDSGSNSTNQAWGHYPSATTPSAQAVRVSEPITPAPLPAKSGGLSKDQKQQQVRQTKDRMKLQQESLAHKRKALGLRREGKTDEAEAEFELAKSIEEQMKDLEPDRVTDAEDMGSVDDIFDPQLMTALKGLGLTDGGIHGGKPGAPTRQAVAQPTSARPATSSLSAGHVESLSSTRAKGLEDRIKAEKLKAVQLKRAGKPTEAMDALREAKKLEKQLLSGASH